MHGHCRWRLWCAVLVGRGKDIVMLPEPVFPFFFSLSLFFFCFSCSHLPLSARLRVLSLSVENFIKHFKADPIAGVGSFQFMILLFSQQIKEKTAYHGRVLNGRKGKLRKIFGAGFPNSLHLLLLLLLLLFLFLFLFGTALMLAAKKCKGGMGDVELRGSWARKKRWTETLWATAAKKCGCVRKEKRNFPAHTESLCHESKFSVAYFLGAIYIFQNKINEGRTREHSMRAKSPKDKSF